MAPASLSQLEDTTDRRGSHVVTLPSIKRESGGQGGATQLTSGVGEVLELEDACNADRGDSAQNAHVGPAANLVDWIKVLSGEHKQPLAAHDEQVTNMTHQSSRPDELTRSLWSSHYVRAAYCCNSSLCQKIHRFPTTSVG